MELETAKEILVEVFCARPGEAEEMMHSRLEEMFKEYSSEAFYVLDDPLEAAVFSVLYTMEWFFGDCPISTFRYQQKQKCTA